MSYRRQRRDRSRALSAAVGLSGIAITQPMSGLPATIPAVLANVSTSIVEPGHARRRLRINGVVSSRSPNRRRDITRIRDGFSVIVDFAVLADRAPTQQFRRA